MPDKSLLASASMVSKVSKLLNQAERAPEGSPEREVFMAKAMELSAAFSIDLAVARAAQAKKERAEEPERRTFAVGQPGLSSNKNAHFVDLMLAICRQNDIECLISGSNHAVYGMGMPSDLDMAERLFAIISVQMVGEADKKLKEGANGELRNAPKTERVEIPHEDRAWGEHDGSDGYGESCYYDEEDELVEDGLRSRGWKWVKSYPPPKFQNVPVLDDDGLPVMEKKWVSTTDARVWRMNFYSAFVSRTGHRLWEARQAALKQAGIDPHDRDDSRAVALRDKSKEVREAHEADGMYVLANTGNRKGYGGAEVSQHSYSGQIAGDEAGRNARHGDEKDLDS